MIKVILKRKIAPRVLLGHPWIFANEVEQVQGELAGGEVVSVYTHDQKFVGQGYANPRSQILVRLLTREEKVTIDETFFLEKIRSCWEYRK